MLERWENIQREKGNTAGAEVVRVMREQYGDVPVEPTDEVKSLPTEQQETPLEEGLQNLLSSPTEAQSFPYQSAGGIIRRARSEKKLGLRELGRRIGRSHAYLGDIERGNRVPTEEILLELAAQIDIDPDEVLAASSRLDEQALEYLREHRPAINYIIRTLASQNLTDTQLKSLLDELSSEKQPEQSLRKGEETSLNEEDSKAFGAYLRQLREQSGKGMRRLAREVGINHSYISYMESGERRPPSEDIMFRLADALNVDTEEFMLRSGKMSKRVKDYLTTNQSAHRLVREIAERDIDEEKIQLLLQEVEQMTQEEK